jgi:branched-chain amino acid aminotransferase
MMIIKAVSTEAVCLKFSDERKLNMLSDRVVYLNGEFIAWENATVHIMSHSFGRGSAIFEVISCHDTDKGPVIFRLQDHIARLFKTAELLDMELPISHDEFYAAVTGTVKKNQLTEGFIKVICYYPQFSAEVVPPKEKLSVSVFALDPVRDLDGGFETVQSTTACVSKWRKLDPQTVPVGAKAAANYLNGMVARLDAEKRGFEHALMLDTQGFVAEGGTECMFLVKDSQLLTSALGTVLRSITRMSVLEAAKIEGIKTVEGRLPSEMIFEADELFFSCSPMKVLPVRQIDDYVLDDVPGPLTRKMVALLTDISTGKDGRFKDWLYPVE